MAKWINSAREFLGLGEDPYYDDYADDVEDYDDAEGDPREEPRSTRRPPAAPRAAESEWDEGDGGVRMIAEPLDPVAVPPSRPRSDRNVVRPLPTASKPEVVSPSRFDDVQLVADAFKKMHPVIVNLQGLDKDLSRRLIDFASGLCYGLEGEMERVAEQVFLLTPKGAEVSADDRRRIEEGRVSEYDS